ncbi:MAG: hypothetical protein EH225_03905 [Calditrichaeota bacterium]|nr:SoxR reducing system RseC family protein [Calditrichota bacterium]RQW05976.1 MAG: hypothetical protein EH225_03905 [Calditrichota bacterium]
MKERGIVINRDATGINVEMHQGFNCEGCNACFIDKNRRHILHITQDISVERGQQVEVEVRPGYAVKSALLIFLLPLLMLIGGYFLFDSYIHFPGIASQYQGMTGALVSFVFTYLIIFLYDKYLNRPDMNRSIRIVRIIKN